MSKAIQRRRGTTDEHAGFTGLVGELTIDTTKNTVVVHDGVTAGGHPLAKENHNHDTVYASKAHESSTSAHPEMTASDAEVDAGTGSKWVKVSQLIRATVKTISSILPITLGGTGASTPEGARTNLGLGSVATENTVPVAKGGTGATTADGARTNLGLGDAATRSVASTSTGAADSGKLPALDATGKLPSGFIPTVEVSYVPEAGHATTADYATTAGSADTATSATTADSATNADKVDGYHASQVPNPNTIPVADAAGKLDAGWLPAMEAATVGGYAPSITPGASKIPVADTAGKLDVNWLPPLNADQVDGFHAQKTPAADRIPVAGADGKLDANWIPSANIEHGVAVFTASGSWTVPAGVTAVFVTLRGGGGGGAGVKLLNTVVAGTSGGTTSFGAYASATGGIGGRSYSSSRSIGAIAGSFHGPTSLSFVYNHACSQGAQAVYTSGPSNGGAGGGYGGGGGGGHDGYDGYNPRHIRGQPGGRGGVGTAYITGLTPGEIIPITIGSGGTGGNSNGDGGRGTSGAAFIWW